MKLVWSNASWESVSIDFYFLLSFFFSLLMSHSSLIAEHQKAIHWWYNVNRIIVFNYGHIVNHTGEEQFTGFFEFQITVIN